MGILCIFFNSFIPDCPLLPGTYDYHRASIEAVRAAAARGIRPVAIALDTKGPEIRTGVLKAGVNAEMELVTGKEIRVTINDAYKDACDENYLWVDYSNIIQVGGVSLF